MRRVAGQTINLLGPRFDATESSDCMCDWLVLQVYWTEELDHEALLAQNDPGLVHEGFIESFNPDKLHWTIEFEDRSCVNVDRAALNGPHCQLRSSKRAVTRWSNQKRLQDEIYESVKSGLLMYQVCSRSKHTEAQKVSIVNQEVEPW